MSYERIWPILRALRFELEREFPLSPGLSIPEREALLFSELLKRVPVGVSGLYEIAGEMGMEFVPETERAGWEHRIKAYENAPRTSSSDSFKEMFDRFGFSCSNGGGAHTTIDYPLVLDSGLKGVCAKIDAELPGSSLEKGAMLKAMKHSLEAFTSFARRFQHPLCKNVPWEPATTFAEGLQCVWLLHEGVALSEQCSASLSFGRFDQYLFKLYAADLKRGVPESQLEASLASFFRMLDNPSFADGAMALNLGGRDEQGRSLFNDLSRLIVRVACKLRLPAPMFTAHVDASLSQADFDSLCVPELLTIGQPTFYGEASCRKALAVRGIPESEIPNWAANSCMGLMMPGQEWSDMWGSVIILPVVLELALNKGVPFKGPLPIQLKTPPKSAYASFDEVYEKFCAYASELISLYIEETERRREEKGLNAPNPFVSALLDDCISRGLDRLNGGVRYRTLILETFGLINSADALLAIKKLAFDSKEFSLETLVEAAKTDYEGAAGILSKIKSLPKYGNADPEADAMASNLAARMAKAVSSHSKGTFACAPSFHTLTGNVDRGTKVAASLDGRRAGEPLSKNAGTRAGVALKGHTALILSATEINQAEFFGGQPVDLSFNPSILKTKEGKRQVQSLIKTYFKRGGLQLQVNGLSPALLREAIVEPEKHRDLIVRIGGYSARFTTLSKATQQDFISRFETGV